MDYEGAKKILRQHGQLHLLEYYGELSDTEKNTLLGEIEKVNFCVLNNINNNTESVNRTEKSLSDYQPIVASSLEDIAKNREKYEKEGLKLLRANKVGAVLLAGGQGTRLGFDKPKGMFNIGETRTLSIFEQQMRNIKQVTDLYGGYFPIFVMTSSINNDETRKFFKDNGYFGYPEEKIHFYVQNSEPVCSFDGKILLSEKHRLALSPNGNGGWYSSLKSSGLKEVIDREGIEWLNVYAVDNVLQRICDPVFIGATVLNNFLCGAKVVKKACPEEKVGVLCKKDESPYVVEYYELPPELANRRDERGELVFCYGVILNYLFNVHTLDATVSNRLPYHLAKKKVPYLKDGKLITPDEPNAYKFETLVVDMVKFMGNCLAFEVEREKEFAPVKNKTGVDSVDTARALMRLNGIKL